MRVWVDLSNSPHPLLFAPVARALEARGHEVIVTARDNAQTVPLALERWPDLESIGGESPAGRLGKARGIASRVAALARWARDRRPDVALSHNSYAQIVAARWIGVPAVTAMDFEHQPANHLAFRLARRVLLPEAFPAEAARSQGGKAEKLVRYPGLKESLYLGDFEPSEEPFRKLGIDLADPHPLVVARTPPSRAIYHRLDNPLFEACLRRLDGDGVTIVVLPRHSEQKSALRELGFGHAVIASNALDSRSLLCRASLFLGAGGTMTREAALLGVPTASLFAGEVPAVDRWLEERGALVRSRSPAELPTPRERPRDWPDRSRLLDTAEPILDRFVAAVESVA